MANCCRPFPYDFTKNFFICDPFSRLWRGPLKMRCLVTSFYKFLFKGALFGKPNVISHIFGVSGLIFGNFLQLNSPLFHIW